MSTISGINLENEKYNITLPLLASGFTTTAGNSTSGSYLAAKWAVANVNGITTPVDGMTIAVRVPLAGNSGGVLLSIDGGTTYYPIVRNVNTLVTTTYAVGSTVILTFNATQTASPYLTAGTATSVTGCWQTADYDANTTYTNLKLGHGYGTCDTAAGTKAKAASISSSYTLTTGGITAIKFTNGITVASPTLNINSKGAKSIYYNGAALTDTSLIKAGDTVTFIYSTQYHIIAINRDTDTNYYHTPTVAATASTTLTGSSGTSNQKIATGTGVSDLYVPVATGSTAGVTIVYPEANCTSYTSDSGTVTPAAVQKGAKMFAITRPPKKNPAQTVTANAVARWENTDGDLKDSKITIEDVTNTKDSSKKANVLVIPAEGNKKMVYGYCTDQVDGTSFIGGVFDKSATSYPYASGLAIGGTSGNLLWKGNKVIDTTSTELTSKAPLASPTFTGTPKAPTAAAGTNTTQIATTAFVTSAVSGKAALASPTFTGTPKAPTAAAGTNTTQIATTAFVQSAISTAIGNAIAASY